MDPSPNERDEIARAVAHPVKATRPVSGWAAVGIFLILLFFFIEQARSILMPITLALLLFFVFVPLRRFLARFGIGASLSAALISLGLVVVIGLIGALISGPIQEMIRNAPEVSGKLEQRFTQLKTQFSGIEKFAAKIEEISHGGAASPSGTGPSSAPANAAAPGADQGPGSALQPGATGSTSTGGAVVQTGRADGAIKVEVTQPSAISWTTLAGLLSLGPEIVGQVAFTLLMLFFLLSSGEMLYLKIVQSFDTTAEKRDAYRTLREIEDSLGTYLGTITLINACLGVVVGTVMWLWGMPSPILFGVGVFVLNYIPYLGPITGVIITFIVAIFGHDDLWTPFLIALSHGAICAIEGQIVTPMFVSRKLELNTVVVFTAVALWGWLWSVLGMIVAVPILVVIHVLASHIPGLQTFGNFLAGADGPKIDELREGPEPAATPAPR
ncbi:AI-2E family transporter [Paracoccus aminophilus]|uniref:Permease n=1 Tax=Paracoccus aminophilus JCM 7686 TaxID=1367847 RepID=S5Y2B3_PARAH|nr:AI-2E family transporter [Paracoccus aminophilus]AGT09895.1 hypothetical protein JCM7686_2839 [Paracoccus aminophilus JCM 7686]